ncbi:MAG: hypothetical protein M3Z08_19475 [Chloroflexota bacterium]|nr:hypothetical protein [Chloroflexota bacterium]
MIFDGKRRSLLPVMPIIYGLFLSLLLVACGGGSDNAATTPTVSTPPPAQPTSAPASNMATYRGDGYSIGYPNGWKIDKSQSGFITFSDPQGIAYLTVHVMENPGGFISPSNQVDAGLQLFQSRTSGNYHRLSVASTTSVGGDTWNQGSATGNLDVKGQSAPVPVKVVVIADNHPANAQNSRGYSIAYATAEQVFDLANEGEFQPMLQAFRFA